MQGGDKHGHGHGRKKAAEGEKQHDEEAVPLMKEAHGGEAGGGAGSFVDEERGHVAVSAANNNNGGEHCSGRGSGSSAAELVHHLYDRDLIQFDDDPKTAPVREDKHNNAV